MKGIRFSRKSPGIVYVIFLFLFVVMPLLIILYYAFTDGQGQFTFENFQSFFTNGKTIGTLFYSVVVAVSTTVVTLLIAYPVAYILAKGAFRKRDVLLMLFIIPMWINFTLRITALKEILTLIESNLAYYPFINTVLGMTYDFLPFMILPIYNTIIKIDDSFSEAAADLGAKPYTVFVKVMLPLSMPGIISGVTMVFLPAMTNYVVLDMVYNSTYIMGSLIGSYFNAYDWHNGSMISVILLALIILLTLLTEEFAQNRGSRRGGVLVGRKNS